MQDNSVFSQPVAACTDRALDALTDFRLPPDLDGKLTLARAAIWYSRRRQPSKSLFGYDPATQRVCLNRRYEGSITHDGQSWTTTATRNNAQRRAVSLLATLAPHGLPFHADMRDRRRGQGRHSWEGWIIPVFQHNREAGAQGAILWTLDDHFQRVGSPTFFGSGLQDDLPFRHKIPRIFWRGALSGRDSLECDASTLALMLETGSLSREACLERVMSLPRFALAHNFRDHSFCDIAIVDARARIWEDLYALPRAPRLARAQMCRARYQLVVEGNDWGSNFPWLCETNCLILRQEMAWEVFFDCLFKPWVHYVPIASDFSDLEEKFHWCEAHHDACEAMVANAQDMARRIAAPGFIEASNARVIARYRDLVRGLTI